MMSSVYCDPQSSPVSLAPPLSSMPAMAQVMPGSEIGAPVPPGMQAAGSPECARFADLACVNRVSGGRVRVLMA
jgi:hypothetical protein